MAFYFEYVSNFLVLKSTKFRAAGMAHGFGTRVTRSGADADLRLRHDSFPATLQRRSDYLQRVGDRPRASALLRQTHSALVWEACLTGGIVGLSGVPSGEIASDPYPEGDALVTGSPGLLLAIQTADCFPVLLADPERCTIAAVHSGWRGTYEGVSLEAVRAMIQRFRSRPDKILAAVGPGIQRCCYEVSHELARNFSRDFSAAVIRYSRPAMKPRLDLAECIRLKLIRGGLAAENIEVCPLCTRCLKTFFHSYRRDGPRCGRMLSFCLVPEGSPGRELNPGGD